MNMIIRKSLLAVVALAAGATALAHHSAVQFDFAKTVTYTGTVKSFQAINPHMHMIVQLKDAKGTRDVHFEGHSTNNMYRSGYRKGMVKIGEQMTVSAAPFRDGTEGGYVVGAKVQDGRFFGSKGRGAADEVRRQAEGR
ncbi:MAG: DUF6152 family protein [Steroidobacteraceae bacterium]